MVCSDIFFFTSHVDINECRAPFLPEEGGDESSVQSYSFSYDNVNQAPTEETAPDPLITAHEEQESCQGGGLLPPNEERCHALAICTNTEGSFSCDCLDNYIGNGTFCKGELLVCALFWSTHKDFSLFFLPKCSIDFFFFQIFLQNFQSLQHFPNHFQSFQADHSSSDGSRGGRNRRPPKIWSTVFKSHFVSEWIK